MKFSLWPLTVIIYAAWPLRSWQAGAFWGVIFIRPDHRDDLGIEAHELTHARQFYEFLGIGFMLLYCLHARSRFAFEASAYRENVQHADYPDLARAACARSLVDNYRLGITFDEALAALGGAAGGLPA